MGYQIFTLFHLTKTTFSLMVLPELALLYSLTSALTGGDSMRVHLLIVKPKIKLMLPLAIGFALIISILFHSIAQAPGQPGTLAPLAGVRIVVDPGHGGVDGGCGYSQTLEKDLNLSIGRLLADNLRQLGSAVQLTRTKDEALVAWGSPGGSRHKRDLTARVQVAKDFGAQIFLSIHVNAGPSHLGGALVFFQQHNDESRRLAGLIQERLAELIPGNQNGILPAQFLVLTQQRIPAVLIELGFLTNDQDRQFLLSAEAPALISDSIAVAVTAYIQGNQPAAPTLSPFPAPQGDDPDLSSTLPYPGCLVAGDHL
jgi:N-acetylmuramoyl-L-alanine amidase